MDEYGIAVSLEIIRHSPAAPDEDGRGRMLRDVDQNTVGGPAKITASRARLPRPLRPRLPMVDSGNVTWRISTSCAVCRKAISRKATRVDSLKKFCKARWAFSGGYTTPRSSRLINARGVRSTITTSSACFMTQSGIVSRTRTPVISFT